MYHSTHNEKHSNSTKLNLRSKFYFLVFSSKGYLARASSLSRLHDHTQTCHNRYDYSGRVISPTQGPLRDNTQHSQEKDIHAPDGIRIHSPSKRETAHLRLRPRGRYYRLIITTPYLFKKNNTSTFTNAC